MESFEKNQYVLHACSGYEDEVKTNIGFRTRSMKMADPIFRVTAPEERETEVRNRRKKEIAHKILPGYVLAEMITTDASWYVVRNTPDVTGFVDSHGTGSRPVPLLPEEVNHILRSIGMGLRQSDLEVGAGEVVRVIRGVFAGLKGQVTEVNGERGKLKASIGMFGRETGTELGFD